MNKTKLIAAITVVLALLATLAMILKPWQWFYGAYTVIEQKVTDKSGPLNIQIAYPQVKGLDEYNKRIKDIIDTEVKNFKENALGTDETIKKIDPENYAKIDREYGLNIGYDKGEVNNKVVSVVLQEYNFTGGAHGSNIFIPINYNPETKKYIALADLFMTPSGTQPDYLKKISDFCVQDLTKQITQNQGSIEGAWIEDGAGPREENFSTFLINKDSITFYFAQYQVAYGAAGEFKVVYPLNK